MTRFRKTLLLLGLALVVAGAAGYAWLCGQRHEAIREVLVAAGAESVETRPDALVAHLNSVPLGQKNRVIWVMGELRDPRVLATLEGLCLFEECDHDRFVCQREVRKAIRKIEGKTPNPYFW